MNYINPHPAPPLPPIFPPPQEYIVVSVCLVELLAI